jgi:hypothetical protein
VKEDQHQFLPQAEQPLDRLTVKESAVGALLPAV